MFARLRSVAAHSVRPLATVPSANVASKAMRRKWRNVGFRRDPNPGEKMVSYGGKSLEMTVIKVSADKTVHVAADHWRRNPTYGVNMGTRIKFLAHDPNNLCHPGDKVLVVPSRPYSKEKRHEIKRIIKKDPGVLYLAQHPELYVDQSAFKQLHAAEMKARKFEQLKKTKKRLLTVEEEEKQKKLEEAQAAEKKAQEDAQRAAPLAEAKVKTKTQRRRQQKAEEIIAAEVAALTTKKKKKSTSAPQSSATKKKVKEKKEEGKRVAAATLETAGEQPKTRAETLRIRKAEAAKKQAKLIDQIRTDEQSGEMKEMLSELRKREAEVKRQYGVEQQQPKRKNKK